MSFVVDHELGLGIDSIFPVGERKFKHLRLGNSLSRTGLHTQVAVNATQIIDLVHEAKTLTWRYRCLWVIIGSANIDASSRAYSGTELTADTLFHPIRIPVQHVSTMEARRLRPFLLWVLAGHSWLRYLL
jgi:hypothetical protein